jgi:replicative DNA helicase
MIHDIDCEKVVLGTILSDKYAINEVRDLLDENCFYDLFNASVYKAIMSVIDKGDTADILSVNKEMMKLGMKYDAYELSVLSTNRTFDIHQHALTLNELAKRRKLFELGQMLTLESEKLSCDINEVIGKIGTSVNDIVSSSQSSICNINEAIQGVYHIMGKNRSGKKMSGSKTGFYELDERSGGFQKSDLIIIAGESSQGKTSFAVSIMNNIAKAGGKVAMYSMEMRKEQIVARMLSSESGISSSKILYSNLESHLFECVDNSAKKLSGLDIYFDDKSTSSIDNIINSIRSIYLKYGIDGAIIDYLQIVNMNMKGVNKEQQTADVVRRLKNLAKELDIWIVAISQLGRDKIDPVPNINRLRDSGQIQEAADVVLLVYRPEVYGKPFPYPFESEPTSGRAMIDVAKGRNIGLVKFTCGFDSSTTKFYDTSEKKDFYPDFRIESRKETDDLNNEMPF